MEFANAPKATESGTCLLLFYFSNPRQFQASLCVQPPPADLPVPSGLVTYTSPIWRQTGIAAFDLQNVAEVFLLRDTEIDPYEAYANDIW